jgi:phosphoglycolate phosphatase
VAYPGVSDSLVRLTRRGAVLHIATNKRSLPTGKIVRLLGWGKFFRSVYCVDSVRTGNVGKASTLAELVRKERIDPLRAVFVGDSIEDAEAASLAGMGFVGVTWGYGSQLLVERFPDALRVSSPADLG